MISRRKSSSSLSGRSAFTWNIVCRSGVLSFGTRTDFLSALVIVKQEKARWSVTLPYSTLRGHLLYPNGQRASKHDIRAAFNALSDEHVRAAVFARLATAAGVPPTAQARTERTAAAAMDIASCNSALFRQAGVVAPPDSPDLGNSVEFASIALGG